MEKTFGWDPEILWPRTTWWHVSELLRNNQRPLSEMAQALEVRDELAERVVSSAVRRGRLFYVYDVERIVADASAEADRWAISYAEGFPEGTAPHRWQKSEWFRRVAWDLATSMLGRMRQYRIYALADDVVSLREKHTSQLTPRDCRMFVQGRHSRSHHKSRRWLGYTVPEGLWGGVSPADDLGGATARLDTASDLQSIVLSRRKSERLEYFFCPRSDEVLRAVVENAARLFELIDRHSPRE